MPLKIHIAISRKVGQPNYGSRGATVGFELEAEAGLADQPLQLQERIAHMFGLAKQSVDRELNGARASKTQRAAQNAIMPPHQPDVRPATCAQVRAIYALSNCNRLDLVAELSSRYSVNRPEDLTLIEASQLIDAFKVPIDGTPPS